jgi:cation diffusion facilitator CzcD-associated flavoprotein CzcO
MAFTDALIDASDADVVLVDRRFRPGGHWIDAYPFVRLHQPSAYYGVSSRPLGDDAIDVVGPNAGFYERATAAEICDYFERLLDEQFLPSGRVRFFGMSDYTGDWSGEHRFVSRLTGDTTTVRVRRKMVDARYLETSIPKTHAPTFGVDPSVKLIPINDLVELSEPASGYTIIGSGKTAMDACGWLLDNGVSPDSIRWIRPRDAWILDRRNSQPLAMVSWLLDGVSLNMEAAAHATDAANLFARLEASGQLMRIDPAVEPSMYRCAILSRSELETLRRIENVVRMGHIVRIEADRIVLEQGNVPTDGAQVHVDCTASGLTLAEDRPIYEEHRITIQQVRTCQPTFNAALVGFVETLDLGVDESNRLCPPNRYPDKAVDWIRGTWIAGVAQALWFTNPEINAWLDRTRLNAARGIAEHMDEPRTLDAMTRYVANAESSRANLERLMAEQTAAH